MSERRLSKLDPAEVRAKAERNESLTIKELAVWTGYSYEVARSWQICQEPRFPLLNGKIFPDDFVLWRRRRTGLEFGPGIGAHPMMQSAGKSDESLLRHG